MKIRLTENVTKQQSLVGTNSQQRQRKMLHNKHTETAKTNQINTFPTDLKEPSSKNIKNTCLQNGDSPELKLT